MSSVSVATESAFGHRRAAWMGTTLYVDCPACGGWRRLSPHYCGCGYRPPLVVIESLL